MDFITDQSEFSREAREEREDNIGSLFLWSVVIVALIGLNAFSWVFCMYVFGNPEVPFNYQLLTKLKRLDPITSFEPVNAPRGKFHAAKSLYLEHYDDPQEKLNAYNGILKRFYLKNYKERDDVIFVSGSFKVESARDLQPRDIFPHGVAVRLQAEDFPAAHIDLVLPSPAGAAVPGEHFRPGDLVQIPESAFCAALLHVHRMEDEQFCFTVVPLVRRINKGDQGDPDEKTEYFETPAGTKLQIAPPERLNLASGHWPISDDGALVADPLENGAEPAPAAGDAADPDPGKSTEKGKGSPKKS